LGGSLRSASVDGAFTVAGIDGFNRQYQYDLGQTIQTAPTHNVTDMFENSDRLLHYREVALDQQGSRAAFASTHLADNTPGLDAISAQHMNKDTLAGAALVQKLGNGHEFATGTGNMNLFFGLAGSTIEGVSTLAQGALSNPYMGLVSQATSAGYGVEIAQNTHLKLGFASSKLANTLGSQYGVYSDHPAQANMAMAEVSHQFKEGEVGIEVAKLSEQQALLGTQLGTGFGLNESANTTALTLHGAWKLSEKAAIAGYISQGYTNGFENGGNSLVSSVSSTRSQAFGVGLTYADAFKKDDRFTVSLSSPLTTTSGQMQLNVPTNVDEQGNLIREVRSVSLASPSREMRAEANYTLPLSKNSALSTTLMLRQNANSVAGEKEVGMALRYTLSF